MIYHHAICCVWHESEVTNVEAISEIQNTNPNPKISHVKSLTRKQFGETSRTFDIECNRSYVLHPSSEKK